MKALLTALRGGTVDGADPRQCVVRRRFVVRRSVHVFKLLEFHSVGFGTHKRSRRLDGVDMLVQMQRKRPFRCTGLFGAVFMDVGRVLGRKQFLGVLDADLDVDPVFRRTVVELVDAIGEQPLMNEVQSLVLGLDKSIDFVVA
jgi:hypothetical protein